jgi:hypothetical protein
VDLLTLRGTGSLGGVPSPSDPHIYVNQNGCGTPVRNDGYGKTADPEYKLVKAIRASSASPKIHTGAINYWANCSWGLSVAGGLEPLTAEMNILAGICPNTEVVLSGHSQGAYVIDELTDSSSNFKKLRSQAQSNLVGIDLEGDPSYWAGQKIDAPGNGKANSWFLDGLAERPKYSYDKSSAFRSFSTTANKTLIVVVGLGPTGRLTFDPGVA